MDINQHRQPGGVAGRLPEVEIQGILTDGRTAVIRQGNAVIVIADDPSQRIIDRKVHRLHAHRPKMICLQNSFPWLRVLRFSPAQLPDGRLCIRDACINLHAPVLREDASNLSLGDRDRFRSRHVRLFHSRDGADRRPGQRQHRGEEDEPDAPGSGFPEPLGSGRSPMVQEPKARRQKRGQYKANGAVPVQLQDCEHQQKQQAGEKDKGGFFHAHHCHHPFCFLKASVFGCVVTVDDPAVPDPGAIACGPIRRHIRSGCRPLPQHGGRGSSGKWDFAQPRFRLPGQNCQDAPRAPRRSRSRRRGLSAADPIPPSGMRFPSGAAAERARAEIRQKTP